METVLITGINGNLGRVVSSIFLSAGYQLVGIDRDNSNDMPDHPNASFYTCDLVDVDSTKSTMDKIFSRHTITHTLLLAGGFAIGSLEKSDLASVQKMIDINFSTAYNLTHGIFQYWKNKRQGGKLVFVTSKPALEYGGSFATPYSLSKSMLVKLTEIVNEEGNQYGIFAYAIAPEIINTAINRESMPNEDHSKWVTPEGIGNTLLNICAKDSALTQPILRMYNR